MGVIQNTVNQAIGTAAIVGAIKGVPEKRKLEKAVKKAEGVVQGTSDLREIEAATQSMRDAAQKLANKTGAYKDYDLLLRTEDAYSKARDLRLQYSTDKAQLANGRVAQQLQAKKAIQTSLGEIGPDHPLYNKIKENM